MMRKTWKRLLPLAFVALAAVSWIASSSAQRQDSTPFKLMIMVGINAVTNNYPEAPTAAQAAADAVNKKGGIGGRPLEIVP